MKRIRILSSGEHVLAPRTEAVRHNGVVYARKSYPRTNPLSRALLHHEARILRRLRGVPGIPRLVRVRPGRYVLTEFFDGVPIHELAPERLSQAVYRRLERVVEGMHRARVAHLDLRQRRNILVDRKGDVAVVDFQSSVWFPHNGLLDILFEICRWVDRSALLRWKHRYFPGLMTRRDRARLRWHRLLRPFWFVSPFRPRRADEV